ncbi:MAG TPA: alpha/beta hydrolase [Caulobacteraceae bacterium]|nr:alpha/beta hydrolase [Caulobacteraceae bacterium]
MNAEGYLGVPAGRVFYRIAGFGPPLVLIAGGEAGADAIERLQCELLYRFRVIAFDRRGLSRSASDDAGPAISIESHAEDVRALIEQVAKEPAYVFGSAIGGLVGLELLCRRPECVRRLVAHEPPTSDLLGAEEEARLREALAEMQVSFRREGLQAALRIRARLVGADPEDREADVEPPELTPERERNLAVLMTNDLPAVRQYRLDLTALRIAARKIIPAGGRSTGATLLHECAVALARTADRPLVELPGGHTGWLLRPAAFGAALAALLDEGDASGDGARQEPEQRDADPRPS